MPSDIRHLRKRLGSTVRQVRLKCGLSQMMLAEKADLTLNYVGEIERGEKLASVETLVRLGRALGMNGADLLKKAEL